jgi:hypothetical protein
MDGWDDSLIYGEDSGKPVQAVQHEVEAEKPPEIEPQFDGPITTITIHGLAWWVQDKDVEQQLITLGEGVFQLLDMEFSQEDSGRFRGMVQCQVRTDEAEVRITALLQRDLNLETATPDTKLTVRVSSNRSAKAKAAAPSKFKPAPMFYDDPQNPIPRYLLPDRPKKPDDSKRNRKERDRDSRHREDRDRDRDRARRHRRDERDRDRDRDYYSDYDDDYDYDRRGKDDREDRKRRRDDDRYREDRKRRK